MPMSRPASDAAGPMLLVARGIRVEVVHAEQERDRRSATGSRAEPSGARNRSRTENTEPDERLSRPRTRRLTGPGVGSAHDFQRSIPHVRRSPPCCLRRRHAAAPRRRQPATRRPSRPPRPRHPPPRPRLRPRSHPGVGPIQLVSVTGVTPTRAAPGRNAARDHHHGSQALRDAGAGLRRRATARSATRITGDEHYVKWSDVERRPHPRPDPTRVGRLRGDATASRPPWPRCTCCRSGARFADVPDVGGALTQWHVHDDLCLTDDPKQKMRRRARRARRQVPAGHVEGRRHADAARVGRAEPVRTVRGARGHRRRAGPRRPDPPLRHHARLGPVTTRSGNKPRGEPPTIGGDASIRPAVFVMTAAVRGALVALALGLVVVFGVLGFEATHHANPANSHRPAASFVEQLNTSIAPAEAAPTESGLGRSHHSPASRSS